MFIDPLGQFTFELPLGWGYSQSQSNLVSIVFNRFDKPNESISIQAMPSLSDDASLDEWKNLAIDKVFASVATSPQLINCGDKVALYAKNQVADANTLNKHILLLQGELHKPKV